MPGREPHLPPEGEDYASQLGRAREPFVSLVEAVGFGDTVAILVRSSRRFLEENPREFDTVLAKGTRDEGAIWYAAEAAERTRQEVGYEVRSVPGPEAAAIPARIFSIIAYHHPYFDGNKRTAFIAASIVGFLWATGSGVSPYSMLEEEVRELTAREASEEEVSAWFLTKVFMVEDPAER